MSGIKDTGSVLGLGSNYGQTQILEKQYILRNFGITRVYNVTKVITGDYKD